ncbi:malto-oligosyltrehalose synthase [Hoeflea olei]|uniref:Malto-oligosyltrehalose synthase n=1 Tax=Hoeflea olei TaxID=1480615 RepID=A0A1C1YU67_9HYPH|nr:malto-oligosyltrehalose synthase [Hoeflea olei]OCW56975.1 malto-oligosyltrehalose synthase [Hoeflea olei]
MSPRASYRFQFHSDFTFAEAEALVPYLERLGVSHVYASPVTTAAPGSMHGYDVVDPTRVDPALGGEEGLASLSAALRARGMGLIIDIVPNHMGVAGNDNAWWNDVLQNGRDSRYAHFFDIDWRRPLLLPLLGAPLPEALENGDIALDASGGEPDLVLYGERRLPLRREDHARARAGLAADDLPALLDHQHYRLAWWRAADDELNWRRFFTINDLAGLRVEDPEVFEESHALYFRLYREGVIDGVRIDHVDGLTDPAGYCRRLRARFDSIRQAARLQDDPAYIVVEKILGPGEGLATDWGVDGTSGYDFMEDVSALLHDPAGAQPLGALWSRFSGRTRDFEEQELQARQDMLDWSFDGQFEACVAAFVALAASSQTTAGLTRGMLRRAIRRMLWVFPVYRTYGTGASAPESDAWVRENVRAKAARFSPPGEDMVVDHILAWLAGEGPGAPALAAVAVQRFQQLSAPIAAKSVEDTAFYRHGLLLSRADVGFDASRFSLSVGAFHRAMIERARDFPRSMLATATHDHKRGEDLRVRLAVLSAIPGLWRDRVERWDDMAGGDASGVVPGDRYMLLQTLYGAWPPGLAPDDRVGLGAYADRIADWQRKMLREAKLHTSWEAPQETYEEACERLSRALLDPSASPEFLADLTGFVDLTAGATLSNMLVQTGLRCMAPGMPDLYQGAELADFSLVDPDNRRPVDFAQREAALDDPDSAAPGLAGGAKIALIRDLLGRRRDNPALFARGAYQPIAVSGDRAGHVLAFRRSHGADSVRCVFALRCADALLGSPDPAPFASWWGDTALEDGTPVARLLAGSPVHVG